MYSNVEIGDQYKSAKVSGGAFRVSGYNASYAAVQHERKRKLSRSYCGNTNINRLTHDRNSGSQYSNINDNYIFEEELGQGAFATVIKAKKRLPSGQISYESYAVKQINKKKAGSKGLKEVYGEVETLMLLTHQNIVRLEETFEDEDTLYIVMEYLAGGELSTAIAEAKEKREFTRFPLQRSLSNITSQNSVSTERSTDSVTQPSRRHHHNSLSSSSASILCGGGLFPENTVRKMVMYILLALQYIHGKGFAHRDLKPANCLLANPGEPLLKIADFGFAVLVGSEECLSSYCGTVAYMAPEILLHKPYGKAVDMWSLGVIVFQLLSGGLPFTSPSGKGHISSESEDLEDVICNGKVDFSTKIWYSVSPGAKDFVRRLLETDSSKRATATECLAHKWLQSAMSLSHSMSCELGSSDNSLDDCLRRNTKIVFKGAVFCVLAAHRLVFWSKCKTLKKEGVDNPRLKCFSFLVANRYRPPKVLDCSGQFIGQSKSLIAFLRMVEVAFTVETLDLSRNEIDNLDTAQTVIKSLTKHPSLIHLILDNNPLPPLIGRSLVRFARASTNRIRTISLNNTPITYEVIKQINVILKETEDIKKANNTVHSKNSAPRPLILNTGSFYHGKNDSNMITPTVKGISMALHNDNDITSRRTTLPERNEHIKAYPAQIINTRDDEPIYPSHFTGKGHVKKKAPLTVRNQNDFKKLPPLPTVSSLTANALKDHQ
eukprot:Tbor_TRINITY_DN4045_c0_g1::TRINITY_DN4045_c0_g1_i1::g.11863::m.11863/K04515/CAMK2; calcium/calmodulin-dependent protein kinase (CaM kinase) II